MELDVLVADHAVVIRAYAMQLDSMVKLDGGAVAQIRADRVVLGANTDTISHSQSYVAELRSNREWGLIESIAPRNDADPDTRLATASKTGLVDALMRSDETTKRIEAAKLAGELLAEEDASLEIHLLAAGAAEVVGDEEMAVEATTRLSNAGPQTPP